MKLSIPKSCGNAPRHQIISSVLAAVFSWDESVITQWLHPEARWQIIGDRMLTGAGELKSWVDSLGSTQLLEFESILTHGREGSADGVLVDQQGTAVAFSHVFRFASTVKTAKILEVRSYFISLEA